jgi:molybdopterin-guanine dinucleotide biosynthesis protein
LAKTEDQLFPEKKKAPLRVYGYTIQDSAHEGLIKVGQTTQAVHRRVEQQLKTAGVKNFKILIDESAQRVDGSIFTDFEVRSRLKERGFENPLLEWMKCSEADVRSAIHELSTGVKLSGSHHLKYRMREEQAQAVAQTHAYFNSVWSENMNSIPRFLWNAKMRFGKTFTSYQLAKKLGVKKLLVVTFKPAVEDSWQKDLESHVDFEGWQYFSKNSGGDPKSANSKSPMVYFGSFQDLLGRDKVTGSIKAKNDWIHSTKWDLVIFDEYHFGAWRDSAKELFEGEEDSGDLKLEFSDGLSVFKEELDELGGDEKDFLPIKTRAFLYLSGTPFRALANGEFIEEQIFNWTYTDEQRSKRAFSLRQSGAENPYASLPEMRLMTYQMPDELLAIANKGEFDEFDLNEFFSAKGGGTSAEFKHKSEVQKWLDIVRGSYAATQIDNLKMGSAKPPFPYSDVRLLPYMNHSFWFLPNVAACDAMSNLLVERQNVFWHDYQVLNVSGTKAGVGLDALPPVRAAIKSGFDTKTITLSCGKLTTGVTVPQWSSILMLRNLKSPESYFQAAFRVQSAWSVKNPNGDNPHEEEIYKEVCFVFDFAPTRALRQVSEYGIGLSPSEPNPEVSVEELVDFLPVLAYNGSHMSQIDAGDVLDMALAGTSATLLARKWDSALLVNVDNETLRKVLSDSRALDAVMNIEGFRALGRDAIETVINKSENVKDRKKKLNEETPQSVKKELSAEEKDYKSKRKQIQDKLIKFATRIPAFMYLTDFRENTLQDVITKLEPELFKTVTGLSVADFELLVSLNVFNGTQLNQAVFAFRRYEDASLSYTGLDSHEGLRRYGLYDTVVAVDGQS